MKQIVITICFGILIFIILEILTKPSKKQLDSYIYPIKDSIERVYQAKLDIICDSLYKDHYDNCIRRKNK